LLAAWGLIVGLRNAFLEVIPLAASAILFPIPYYITHTSLRYRHPIDPILTLFAAYAVARMHATLRPTSQTNLQG
jgi:hypothetical protein